MYGSERENKGSWSECASARSEKKSEQVRERKTVSECARVRGKISERVRVRGKLSELG